MDTRALLPAAACLTLFTSPAACLAAPVQYRFTGCLFACLPLIAPPPPLPFYHTLPLLLQCSAIVPYLCCCSLFSSLLFPACALPQPQHAYLLPLLTLRDYAMPPRIHATAATYAACRHHPYQPTLPIPATPHPSPRTRCYTPATAPTLHITDHHPAHRFTTWFGATPAFLFYLHHYTPAAPVPTTFTPRPLYLHCNQLNLLW